MSCSFYRALKYHICNEVYVLLNKMVADFFEKNIPLKLHKLYYTTFSKAAKLIVLIIKNNKTKFLISHTWKYNNYIFKKNYISLYDEKAST